MQLLGATFQCIPALPRLQRDCFSSASEVNYSCGLLSCENMEFCNLKVLFD